MIFSSESSIRSLDDLVLGLGVDLQDLVRVVWVSHRPAWSATRPHPWCRRLPDVEPGSSTTDPSGRPEPPSEPPPVPARQRWRLILARDANPSGLAGRDLVDAFERGLEASGLPLARTAGRTRARVTFGAPLPLGIAAERELADILLADLIPAPAVRERVSTCLPDGWRLVDLFDVWLGAPALASQVAAADYRITIDGADVRTLSDACEAVLASPAIPRERRKGTSVVGYDLRPLLTELRITETAAPVGIHVRTRFDPVLGTGRPEEVVAALGDQLGAPLHVVSTVRECLILAEELD